MNRKPQVGDILKIPGSSAWQIVVAFDEEVSKDQLRGDAYYATTFDTINFESRDRSNFNPKIKKFYLSGGSMVLFTRSLVNLSDIDVMAFSKVRKHIDVTYGFSKVKAAKD